MAKLTVTIDNVFGGLSPTQFFGTKGSYHAGIGIDPDMPVTDSDVRMSGFIRPTSMEKISATTITGTPLWLVTNPKDSNTYCYDNSGKVYSINSSLSVSALNSGTALTSSLGNGSDYYDNYLYFIKNTDVARYGPLNGVPAFNETYWTSTLSKTALTNTTYPTIRGTMMPNHVAHRSPGTNKLFICDVLPSGKGALHYIKTTKTTVEGDTDSASAYQTLDFGYGYYPTTVETFEASIAVALIEGVSTGSKQKPAALTFWDTTSTTFSKLIQVEFPDPLITALKNVNGVLYVWSGNANGGVRVSRFIGGYSYEEVFYSEEGVPPLQGAVDAEMNRVIWGNFTTYPEASVGVMARGSRASAVGNGTHPILKTTSTGANGMVTALKYVQTTGNNFRQPIVAWKDDSAQGIDKLSTTYGTSVFRSEVFRVGRPFTIGKIRCPLGQAITASMGGTIKVLTDNGTTSTTISTLNDTKNIGKRNIVEYQQGVNGEHDFFIEIRTTGTALLTFALPITIDLTTNED